MRNETDFGLSALRGVGWSAFSGPDFGEFVKRGGEIAGGHIDAPLGAADLIHAFGVDPAEVVIGILIEAAIDDICCGCHGAPTQPFGSDETVD